MSKLNHLYNAEKILYVIKRIRNGGILSKYTVVSDQGITSGHALFLLACMHNEASLKLLKLPNDVDE